MQAAILKSNLNIFLLAVVWSAWMLFVGALPNIISGNSFYSLTFEYRDYLLRAFVVFTVAHLFVRQTSFRLLFAIPLMTLALQVGINVYDFSEWFSRSFRVNLHELNAQLFVVPVQLGVLAIAVYFCCRTSLRTTTRIFATVMLAGSIVSTLGFHLSIVNVSYKPVERIYSEMLRKLIEHDVPEPICVVTGNACNIYGLESQSWSDDELLDPQLQIAHNTILDEALASHSWIRRGTHLDHWIGLAAPKGQEVKSAEVLIPYQWLAPLMDKAFGAGNCEDTPDHQCFAIDNGSVQPPVTAYSKSILTDLHKSETYIHAWAHVHDADHDGFVEPAFFASGRRNGGEARLVIAPIPAELLERLHAGIEYQSCDDLNCRLINVSTLQDSDSSVLVELVNQVRAGQYEQPIKLWVDKALSRNPVLYINRPEFLRAYGFKDGAVRLFTSPQSFSNTTLDLKLTFNLIIALFSISWLTFGVFLILFHTKRALMPLSVKPQIIK